MGYPGVIGYYRGHTGIIYNQMEDDIENQMDTTILLELVFLLSLVMYHGLYRGYSGIMETIGSQVKLTQALTGRMFLETCAAVREFCAEKVRPYLAVAAKLVLLKKDDFRVSRQKW